MEPLDVGAKVRQKVPVIEGEVKGVRYDDASKSFSCLVAWNDEGGQECSRWFNQADLEVQNVQ